MKRRRRHFADYIVFLSIFAVTMFTVAAFVLQFLGMMEISATLTTCWFAFWTVEIVALASIKNAKIKKEYDKQKRKMERETEAEAEIEEIEEENDG